MVGTTLLLGWDSPFSKDGEKLKFLSFYRLFVSMKSLLSLSEKLILLATDIEKGNVVANAGISLNYCIAGAVLFEMIEKKLLVSKNEHIVEWPHGLTGDALYDLGLEKTKKPGKGEASEILDRAFFFGIRSDANCHSRQACREGRPEERR